MNMTPDERHKLDHEARDCEDLRQDCKTISESVRKLHNITRSLVGRIRDQDIRLTKLELTDQLLAEHMNDMRVLITNARDDIRSAKMRFEHFDTKLGAHMASDNKMQKQILSWVIVTLVMCMIGIAGWIFDYILKA